MDYEKRERRQAAGLVSCDDETCEAKASPNRSNLKEVLAALDHWEHHEDLSGCSHQR